MKFLEILPIAKDVSLMLAPIFASGIAWFGLSTWKRQTRGVASYEVARGALFMSYQLLDRIKMVRSPMMSLDADKVKANGQLPEELAHYQERQERLIADFIGFKTKVQEGRAIWGDPILDHYNKIDAAIRELRAAIWLHFWMKGAYAGPGATVDNSPARVEKNNEIVYYADGSDPFSQKIDAAFQGIEGYLTKKMRH